MIDKIKSLEQNFSVSKAAFIVGFFALLSRAAGLLRDRLFASTFGAGDTLDVYYAAFRIPDFIFNLLVLGTLSVAFIPVFTELLAKDKARAYKTANTVLNASFLIMSAICILLMFLAKPLTSVLVPGFSEDKLAATTLLTRIFLASPVIFTISNIFSSILNSQKKFFIANLAPILYNVGIIFGLLALYPKFGLAGLGMGVILGALLHLFIQIPEACRFGYFWTIKTDIKDPAVLKIFTLFLPRILGVDNSQISLLVGSMVGSILASGSIAVFNLANNLQAVPLGVFAISTATAVFPFLSELYNKGDKSSFMLELYKSVEQILFFLVPFTILLLLFRAHLVRLVFGAGNFDWNDTILTFNTLGLFAVSLFAQGLTPLFARAFYAQHDTKTPVFTGILAMATNALLAYVFGTRFGAPGMAAAFSAAAILNSIILFAILRHRLIRDLDRTQVHKMDMEIASSIAKICAASLFMGLAGYALLYLLDPLVDTHTVLGLLAQAGLAFLGGAAVFVAVGKYLQIPQLKLISLAGVIKKG